MRKFNKLLTQTSLSLSFTKTLTIALFLVIGTLRVSAQSATSTWALIANSSVAVTGNVTGTAFTSSNGVGTPAYAGTGVSTSGWSTGGTRVLTDYYEYKVAPTAGNILVVSSLNFFHQLSAGGTWDAAVYYSTDNFTTSTQIGADFSPSTTSTSFTSGALSVTVPSGSTFSVRVYAWNASNNTRTFRNRAFVINGTTCANIAFTAQPAATQTLCSGNTLTLTATATNATYQWKKNGVAISGATAATYTKANITTADAGSYTLDAIGSCVTITSNAAVVNVNPSPTGATAGSSAATICSGGTVNLTSSATSNSALANINVFTENFNAATNAWVRTNTSTGGTTANAAWTLRPNAYAYDVDAFSSNDASQFYLSNSDSQGTGGTTTTTLTSPSFSTVGVSTASLTFYHYFRNVSTDAGKVFVSTNGTTWTQLAIYSNAASGGTGTVGADNAFSLATISLNAYTNQATVYIRFQYTATFDWYWAIDNVNVTGLATTPAAPTYAWTSVPAGFTSSLQNPTGVAPTVSTVYTVTATNSYGCTATATASVAVDPVTVPGTVTTSTTVCATSNSGTLNLGAHTGNVIRWESSLDGFTTAGTPIVNTTNSQSYTNLAATTSYRAVVQSGTCAALNSVAATITVNPATVAGTVTTSTTVCATSNSGTLNLGAHTGNVIRWESSLDGFTTAGTPIVNTTNSQSYTNLTATTSYRAVVQSGTCAAANSVAATITVDPATIPGTVTTSTTVCATSNSGTLNLGAHTGNVIRWESSLDGFTTAGTPIVNTTNSQSYTNLTATTSYRAVVQSGTCAAANSVAATITVDPATIPGTVTTSTTVCATSNSGTLNLGAHTGNVIRWESSLDGFTTAGTPIVNTTNSQSYTNLAATTSYRAVVQSGTCAAANSVAATITVNPATVAGTVTTSTTVCATSNSGTLNLGAHTGNVIRWESSLDGFTTAGTPIVNTTNSQSYTNLTATTSYRAVVQSGTCAAANSVAATITVDPATVAGTVTTSTTVCATSNSGTLNLGAHTGNVIRWESSLDSFTTAGTPIVNTTNSQSYTNLTSTTSYRAVVQSGTCAAANSVAATITVDPATIPGTVTTSTTVCATSNSGTLNLGAHTGNVIRWESSFDGFTTAGTPIVNTTNSQSYTNLTATTSYRAVVQSGTCAAANSVAATITVDPATIPGTVTTSTTVCATSNSGTLNLGAHTGNVIRWESSLDGFTTAGTPIVNTSNSQSYTNLTATTSYRAVVQSGTCAAANSVAATITVDPATVAGTVTTSTTVCATSNSGTLNLGAHTGNVIRWESSLDGFTTAGTPIVNTTNSQSYTNLTATTSYRAVVQNGTCAAANSVAATITVDPATIPGTVTTSTTVCATSNSGTLNLGAHTGNVIRWESSLDGFTTAGTPIVNTTNSQSYTNLAATTSYRAVVQNGSCASANSTFATITVDAATVPGAVTADTTVCSGTNSGTLTLGAHTGNIIGWESSLDGFTTAGTPIVNTTNSQSYTNLTATTSYRAVVQNGSCTSANSAFATITVNAASVGGTVGGSTTVCYGNNSGALTLSGQSGTIIRWESSLNNFTTTGVPVVNTTTTLNYTNLLATTYYRAVIGGGACGTVYSSVAVITVDANSIWTGTNSTSWNDAGNWSCGAVPTSDVNVTITAVPNQPVIADESYANTVTMDPSTTLLIQSGHNFRVVNAITGLSGSLVTVENNANLIQENDVDNAGNATVKRTSNPLMRQDYILWSSPVTGSQTLANFSVGTLANRFYIYNPGTNLYNSIAPGIAFSEGTGYLIRVPNTHPATPTAWNGHFDGTLNNGNVNLTVANNTYNAIGNPYPSTLDADMFITDNNLTEALYFWRKTNNDLTTSYATYTLAGGAGTNANVGNDPLGLVPNGVIQVGQGFIAKSTSTSLSFTNSMRIGNNDNQTFRTNEIERNRIWLNLTNAEGIFSQTMVSYMTGATQGVDAAIDGLYFNDSQLALTSMIGDTEYAVQGRALPFEGTDIVPLGFKAITAGTYAIGIDHVDGLFTDVSQNIFLKDNVTGVIHDLRAGSYTFAADAGVSNSRFEIIYQNVLAVTNPNFNPSQVIVYKQNQHLVVNSGNNRMLKVAVYDIRGRLLAKQDNINATETKLNVGTTQEVLIVKVTDMENREVTKKVVN